jgi:hypothetical protein
VPERFFGLGHSIGDWVKENVQSITAPDEDELAYRSTQFFFFCKCYKSYQAIELLWRNGFAQDSAMLARSLFEIVLQAKYINVDPIARTRRYIDFDIVDRMRTYQRIKASGDKKLISVVESNPEALADLKSLHKRVRSSYKKNTWWGESIHWLAQEVELESTYNTMHWEQAGLTHSAGTSISKYIAELPEGFRVSCDPGDEKPSKIAVQVTWALLIVTQQLSVAIDAPAEEQLDGWQAGFVKLSKDVGQDAT